MAGKKNPFDEYAEEATGAPKIPEKLTKDEDLRFAEPLMPTFTEKLILMLFSTDWHTRELALKTIKEDLGSNRLGSTDPEELFVGVFTVASKTGYDKIAQVALETMSLIQTTC